MMTLRTFLARAAVGMLALFAVACSVMKSGSLTTGMTPAQAVQATVSYTHLDVYKRQIMELARFFTRDSWPDCAPWSICRRDLLACARRCFCCTICSER